MCIKVGGSAGSVAEAVRFEPTNGFTRRPFSSLPTMTRLISPSEPSLQSALRWVYLARLLDANKRTFCFTEGLQRNPQRAAPFPVTFIPDATFSFHLSKFRSVLRPGNCAKNKEADQQSQWNPKPPFRMGNFSSALRTCRCLGAYFLSTFPAFHERHNQPLVLYRVGRTLKQLKSNSTAKQWTRQGTNLRTVPS